MLRHLPSHSSHTYVVGQAVITRSRGQANSRRTACRPAMKTNLCPSLNSQITDNTTRQHRHDEKTSWRRRPSCTARGTKNATIAESLKTADVLKREPIDRRCMGVRSTRRHVVRYIPSSSRQPCLIDTPSGRSTSKSEIYRSYRS